MKLNNRCQDLKTKAYNYLWILGELSGCHQLPERSFFINGCQFPVCARCTGAFIGYSVGAVLFLFYRINIFLCVVFCMIMFVDWFLQYKNILQSTNVRRLLTGFICGLGLIQIYFSILQFISEKLSDLFKLA